MDKLDTNDMLVVTIAIQMHGTVITYTLSPDINNIFEDVRLLCKAGGLKEYISGESGMPVIAEEFMLVGNLVDIFGKDIQRSTYDIIKDAKTGIFIGNITFDKTLSTTIGKWSIFDYLQGIYLLSIHKGRQLLYPTNMNEKVINFLKVGDLHRLALFFKPNSIVPNLEDISMPFPNQQIYIEQENRVNLDSTLSNNEKKQKIKEIRKEFMNLLDKWKLTLDWWGNIQMIKLSYLVELVKQIIGKKMIINLLDYSCNAPTSYIPEEESSQYAIVENDIEMGNNMTLGGVKKRKTKRRNRKKRRKIKIRSKRRKSH